MPRLAQINVGLFPGKTNFSLDWLKGTDASAGVKPDSDGDASATQPNADISSARQAFAATLKGFGIDANQFHQDFLAAVQGVQSGGTSDTSTLFQDFPLGSSVDTTA